MVEGNRALKEGRREEALALFTEAAAAARQGQEAAEAFFRRGEALRALGRYEEALEAYDEVIGNRPRVELLKLTLDRKYQIGLDFLQGKAKRYFLGFIAYGSPSLGIEILLGLVRDYPFETFSDDALFSIGNHYFRTEQWEEARPVYERLIESYPTSEWVPPAYYQLGKSLYNDLKGYQYDPTPLARARWYFERFLDKRRVGPEAEEARRYVRELRELEAKHELYVARFYLLNGHREGARLHLETAVKKGRGLDGSPTETAATAQELLKGLTETREASR
jgi:outer membrane assembly lipoprotein YfiO